MKATEQTYNGMRIHQRQFDSWDEFVNAAGRTPAPATYKTQTREQPMRNASRNGRNDWCGGTFDQAIKQASFGWAKGRDLFIEVSEKFKKLVSDLMRTPQMTSDVTGETVNMDAYLLGLPENMLRFEDANQKRSDILSITVDQSVTSSTSTESILRRGASMAALIDLLEEAGYSVRLSIRFTVCSSHTVAKPAWHIITVPVKAPGQPLDLDRIGFALVSPMVYRRMVFSIQEQESESIRRLFGFHQVRVYGYPRDTPAGIKDDDEIAIGGTVLLGASDSQIADWIIQKLIEFEAIETNS